jgi:hypothetical protein
VRIGYRSCVGGVTAVCAVLGVAAFAQSPAPPTVPVIVVDKAMAAPAWAHSEQVLLRANADLVQAYAATHFDEKWHNKAPEEWGVGGGPDDIPEGLRSWPLAYALGGPESILTTWSKFYEGHLEQYTNAKIPQIEMAKNGIYHKEMYTQFDWEHSSEGFAGLYYYGLSRPNDAAHVARAQRLAGLYMNEDPAVKNYDAKNKIIPSLFNGSLGPKMTPATPQEWEGLQPTGRFDKASNIKGDHPLNLGAVMLAFNAYVLTHQEKYKKWALEYVDAWSARAAKNGGNIPSNIGLDGTIGGEWGGKWYGGVFGWNSPDTGNRNYVFRGPPEAFDAALLMTGDQKYTAVMRRQIDNLFAAKKVENGKELLPRRFGDEGWYDFHELGTGPSGTLGNLVNVMISIYMESMDPADLARVPMLPGDRNAQMDTPAGTEWLAYLKSGDKDYPQRALQAGLDALRRASQPAPAGGRGARGARGAGAPPATVGAGAAPGQRAAGAGRRGGGAGTPGGGRGGNTGAAPVAALINLTMGGPDPGGSTHGPLPLNVQVRHFDPDRRRAGLPEDVGALVERVSADSVTLTLVNIHPFREKTVTVQMGAYGEHTATSVTVGDTVTPINAASFTVKLAPGSGDTLTIGVRRYANQPTLAFPWDRTGSK